MQPRIICNANGPSGTYGDRHAPGDPHSRSVRRSLPVFHLSDTTRSQSHALRKCAASRLEAVKPSPERKLRLESLRFRAGTIGSLVGRQLWLHDGICRHKMVSRTRNNAYFQRVHQGNRRVERWMHFGGDVEWQALVPGKRL